MARHRSGSSGSHGVPKTGDGKTPGIKPGKAQLTVKASSGRTMAKATSKLFGIMGNKNTSGK